MQSILLFFEERSMVSRWHLNKKETQFYRRKEGSMSTMMMMMMRTSDKKNLWLNYKHFISLHDCQIQVAKCAPYASNSVAMVTEMVTACSAACLKFQKLDVNEIWQLTGCLFNCWYCIAKEWNFYSIKDSKRMSGCTLIMLVPL